MVLELTGHELIVKSGSHLASTPVDPAADIGAYGHAGDLGGGHEVVVNGQELDSGAVDLRHEPC